MKTLKRGFTLVELLVAMTITSIIILVLVGMSAMGVNAWTKSRAELRASRQGKALVDSMAKDLESKFMRTGNSLQWLYLDRQPSDLVGPDGAQTSNAARFAFFTAATDRYNGKIGVQSTDKGGDISLVRYQIQYVDPINVAKNKFQTYAVYRSLVNPDVCFNQILGTNQTDLKSQFPASGTPTEQDFLCENVYQMTFTFTVQYTKTGETQPQTAQVSIGLDDSASSRSDQHLYVFGDKMDLKLTQYPTGVTAADLASGGVITRVEVMATVISDAGLAELRRGSQLSDEKLAAIVKKNSYQYVKSVDVPQP